VGKSGGALPGGRECFPKLGSDLVAKGLVLHGGKAATTEVKMPTLDH
jgi:hypothetical protein